MTCSSKGVHISIKSMLWAHLRWYNYKRRKTLGKSIEKYNKKKSYVTPLKSMKMLTRTKLNPSWCILYKTITIVVPIIEWCHASCFHRRKTRTQQHIFVFNIIYLLDWRKNLSKYLIACHTQNAWSTRIKQFEAAVFKTAKNRGLIWT